jgi:hypothetical protein
MKTWLFVAAALTACSGTSGNDMAVSPDMAQDTTCDPNATPSCGGTLDGTWTYKSACGTVDTSALTNLCAGATVTNTQLMATGTITFSAGTLTRTAQGSGSGTATIPMSCLFGQPCSAIPGLVSGVTTAVTASNCTTAGSNCTCDLTANGNGPATATYTATGSTLTVMGGGQTYVYDYCVNNGVLKYKGHATNPVGSERYSYVATKN